MPGLPSAPPADLADALPPPAPQVELPKSSSADTAAFDADARALLSIHGTDVVDVGTAAAAASSVWTGESVEWTGTGSGTEGGSTGTTGTDSGTKEDGPAGTNAGTAAATSDSWTGTEANWSGYHSGTQGGWAGSDYGWAGAHSVEDDLSWACRRPQHVWRPVNQGGDVA